MPNGGSGDGVAGGACGGVDSGEHAIVGSQLPSLQFVFSPS